MKKIKKAFDKCPCCGSKNRFFESLAKDAVEMNAAREGHKAFLMKKVGIVIDQARIYAILIGSKVPGFNVDIDICSDCGCVYAVSIESAEATYVPPPPNKEKPGRN